MKIAWLTYLDPYVLTGGGELNGRRIIDEGRRRGHTIVVSSWLKTRPQRALRRAGIYRSLSVDWDADLFVLANIRNHGARRDTFPEALVERAVATGRAIVLADAWVDLCSVDLPCDGDLARCPPSCKRDRANWLYENAVGAIFVSPRHEALTAGVLDVPLPSRTLLIRPCVDPAWFRDTNVARDIDVLYVGSINRAKGYYALLDRFGAERLTFVGRNGLGHPVAGRYMGELPHDRLPEIYNRARHFAHLPEWNEPASRAVVEAGLCGCDLLLNERVGVTSFPDADWRDPTVIARNPQRFWEEFETTFDSAAAGDPR